MIISKFNSALVKFFCAVWLMAGAVSVQAQFTYNSGDVLLCFRDTGAAKTYDLVVDCGPVSTFVSLPAGQKIYLTNYYNPALLNTYVDSAYTNWAWSVCAASANYPPTGNDLWLTNPRSVFSQQTSPLLTGSPNNNGPLASTIDGGTGLGNDAANTFSDSPNQTTTAIVQTANANHKNSNSGCYEYYLLSRVNGLANFQGGQVVEQASWSSLPARADFYQLLGRPSTVNGSAGTFLGYFEISTNGSVVYTSGPSPISKIVKITKSGNTTTIYFTTAGIGGTYTLVGTSNPQTPVTSWSAIGSSITGNGLTNSIQEISASTVRYYSIRAQ